ncbi:SMI1/KNR4 family protein [Conchiformibius steedae DSM 2580]|uniref:SMI1/KNR4 family protein n=1 Tax=Conchiformibius steedae DSM 2580 TaxID=1121352 RepID=A0AAE9L0B3_9NEIS|nr:SMI1/KNR4 family protein [Conchiformibius steedae]QMT33273.1 SMI1/KNR4 family protein [Conchiformibius steedae]URD67914.1 SMI1/KNR4 family protein [Conchiformibius steedae DSM 2580]
MSNLVKILLSIKSPYDGFIDKPELIRGYTEDEIKQIEQKYNFPIHGQFKELLMTMGKCSGGLVSGSDIYVYSTGTEYSFGEQARIALYNDQDCQYFINIVGNIVEKKMINIAGMNEHMISYFMFAAENNDIVYEWDTNQETVREFGTLFDFLISHRESLYRTIVQNPNYPMYGQLL